MAQTKRVESSESQRCTGALLLLALLGACAADGGSTPASRGRSQSGNAAAGGSPVAANGTSSQAPSSTAPGGPSGSNPSTTLIGKGSNTTVIGGTEAGCKGLQCQQHACPTGATTSISGRVYDPAGKNPLYNVAVFVPNEAVEPFRPGASCDKCDSMYTGKAVVSALTDASGTFKLEKAPDGANIPLVIQIGKWRRQLTIPNVTLCQDNALPDKTLTLPKNGKEGDLPNIAIATGGADTLECLLRRIGLDASEYVGGAAGTGHVHIFQGGSGAGGRAARGAPNTYPAAPSASSALWSSKEELMKYDVVLLSCEGKETENMNQQALHDYASLGGRVFASHFHYAWFNTGPYAMEDLATWTPESQDLGDISGTIVTTFPKGMALKSWLTNTNALVNGELPIREARHNADVSPMQDASQPWILASSSSRAPGATQYFSFNTPTEQAKMPDGKVCGRVVFSDLHVGAASNDSNSMSVPESCRNQDLSPQEKALEFMLFDLSACVIPDDVPPAPPPALN
jgi:hypothetical protein